MKQFFAKNKNRIALACITALSFLLGLLFLGQKDLSLDEVATAIIVQNFSSMLHILTYTEGNMWLYYFLLHFWQGVGTNEFALRLLSVLFGTASIPVIYLLSKKLFNTKTALIVTLLTVVNVFFISNEQNARAYSLVLLLTTCSSYFFTMYVLSFLKDKKMQKKYLLLTIIFNVLGVYAHFYTLFVIASQITALLLTRKKELIRSLLYYLLAIGICLLPLFLAPSLRGQPTNWIPVPGLRNLIGTILILSDDFPPVAVLYIALFVGVFISLWNKRKQLNLFSITYWNIYYLLIGLILPIVVSFLFSLFIKPLYISLYFFICLVPFTLLISYFITQIKKPLLQKALIISLVILSSIRLYGWYTGNQYLQVVISNNTEDWRGVAKLLGTDKNTSDVVLFFPPFVQENVNYYLQKNNSNFDKKKEINLQPGIYAGANGLKNFNLQQLLEIPLHYHSLWYIYGTYTDNTRLKQQKLINQMLAKNYMLQKEVKFYNLTAYYYIRK